jgi:hypothetical protein
MLHLHFSFFLFGKLRDKMNTKKQRQKQNLGKEKENWENSFLFFYGGWCGLLVKFIGKTL